MRVVLMVSAAMILAGCGRQAAPWDRDLLAISMDLQALAAPSPEVAATLDATGGLARWMQTRKLGRGGVVTAYDADGSFYVTQQDFAVYPWADAIRVSAREPRDEFIWQVVQGQYRLVEGDLSLDVSALRLSLGEYADAVLEVMSLPVRLLDEHVVLTAAPALVQIGGRMYQPIHATYGPAKLAAGAAGQATEVQPYWTEGIYFQSQDQKLVDLIWLGRPAARRFLLVRGYDYRPAERDGVLIPTVIEVFESSPDALPGRRLARVDLKQ